MSKTEPDHASHSVDVDVGIAASPDAVWKALTDAEELTRWFPLEAKVKGGRGGSVRLDWTDFWSWELRIEAWEPQRHLRTVYARGASAAIDASSSMKSSDVSAEKRAHESESPAELAIDYFIEPASGGSQLRLVHSGFGSGGSWDEEFEAVSRGWRYELQSLRHYLERHLGSPRRVAWAHTPVSMSSEAAWSRLMDQDGLLAEGSLAALGPGDRYAIRTAMRDRFQGRVLILAPPLDFAGTVENLNDALLRVALEPGPDGLLAMLWVATYGVPERRVAELQANFESGLRKLFPARAG